MSGETMYKLSLSREEVKALADYHRACIQEATIDWSEGGTVVDVIARGGAIEIMHHSARAAELEDMLSTKAERGTS